MQDKPDVLALLARELKSAATSGVEDPVLSLAGFRSGLDDEWDYVRRRLSSLEATAGEDMSERVAYRQNFYRLWSSFLRNLVKEMNRNVE